LIEESDPLDHIKAVLFKLSSMLQGSTESERNESGLHRLRRCRIFPIQTHAAQVRFDYLAPAHGNSASGIENWYIADIPHLWESFCGRIPLLAIPPSSIRDLGNLLRYLHLDWHYLSKAATKEIRVQGPAEYDAKYTRKISQKARFISRLVVPTYIQESNMRQQKKSPNITNAPKKKKIPSLLTECPDQVDTSPECQAI